MPTRRVFLSSTSKDLSDHRDAVYKAIEGLDGYHCVRMEDFGARDKQPAEFCRETIAGCELVVYLVGPLYGSLSPNGNSFTEDEFDHATESGKPCLVFLSVEDFKLPASLIESRTAQRSQQAFRKKASRDRLVPRFDEPAGLAVKVVQAIRNWEANVANQESTPCAVEIGAKVPAPRPQAGGSSTLPAAREKFPTGVYAEVRGIRFDEYSEISDARVFALCAPVYILNKERERIELRFEGLEIQDPDVAAPIWITRMGVGIEAFRIKTTLARGESTEGCFRVLSVPKEYTRTGAGLGRYLWLRELISETWIRIPIGGSFPPDEASPDKDSNEFLWWITRSTDELNVLLTGFEPNLKLQPKLGKNLRIAGDPKQK